MANKKIEDTIREVLANHHVVVVGNMEKPIGTELIADLKDLYEALLQEAARELVDCGTGNDLGISSKAIVRHMFNLEPSKTLLEYSAPNDKSDRERCIRVLNRFPEWWNRLDEMSQFPLWKDQIVLIRKEALPDHTKWTPDTKKEKHDT